MIPWKSCLSLLLHLESFGHIFRSATYRSLPSSPLRSFSLRQRIKHQPFQFSGHHRPVFSTRKKPPLRPRSSPGARISGAAPHDVIGVAWAANDASCRHCRMGNRRFQNGLITPGLTRCNHHRPDLWNMPLGPLGNLI